MITVIKKLAFVSGLCAALPLAAFAELAPDFTDKLNSDARPAADKARDDVRRPYQVMQLLGVEEGMTVVDVHSGQGWYAEVLSAAVGPTGRVVAEFGPGVLRNSDGQAQRDFAARLGNVEVLFEELHEYEEHDFADRALTALSLHDQYNFRGEEGGTAFMQAIYDVLKPGGLAVVVDHEGNAGTDNSQLHRIAKEDGRRLIEAVGFEVVRESDLLHTNADDHTTAAFDPLLARNTDRFLFIVRKPG